MREKIKRKTIIGIILTIFAILLYLFVTQVLNQTMNTLVYVGITAVMIVIRIIEYS